MLKISPNFVFHLAAISFFAHKNHEVIYKINKLGSIEILEAFKKFVSLKRFILASSACIYGNQEATKLRESLYPRPLSH